MEYNVKKTPFLKPYTSVDDVRFAWLDQFLDDFEQWNDKGILHRMINPTCLFLGNLMKDSKFTHSKKFASFYLNRVFHTFDLNVSVKMIWRTILVANVLLVIIVTVRDAGYNDNTIKSQYSVRPIAGNVRANLHKFGPISSDRSRSCSEREKSWRINLNFDSVP